MRLPFWIATVALCLLVTGCTNVNTATPDAEQVAMCRQMMGINSELEIEPLGYYFSASLDDFHRFRVLEKVSATGFQGQSPWLLDCRKTKYFVLSLTMIKTSADTFYHVCLDFHSMHFPNASVSVSREPRMWRQLINPFLSSQCIALFAIVN